MCAFDLLSSIALGLSTWPIPSDSPGVYDPKGTIRTCEAQGFFIQANIASPIYNFALSLYYLLLVKYNMTERQLSKRIEPVMQGSIIFFAIGTSFICLGLGFFNDSSLWCWINALPKGCDQGFKDGSGTCERGDNAEIFRWAFFFGPLWAAVVGSWITMGMLYRTVHVQEKKSASWNFGDKQNHRRQYRKSRMVARQAFRYLAVFYLTWIAGTANRLLQLFLGRSFFWIMVLHAIFTPMQGFFNFLVYKYPDYKKWRKLRQSSTGTYATRYSTNVTRFSIQSTKIDLSIHPPTFLQRVREKFDFFGNGSKSETGGGIDKHESDSIQESPKLQDAALTEIVTIDIDIDKDSTADSEDCNQSVKDLIILPGSGKNYEEETSNMLDNEKSDYLDPVVEETSCSVKCKVGAMDFEKSNGGDESVTSAIATFDDEYPSIDEGMNSITPSFVAPVDLYFL